jgi:hypothetical protein
MTWIANRDLSQGEISKQADANLNRLLKGGTAQPGLNQ